VHGKNNASARVVDSAEQYGVGYREVKIVMMNDIYDTRNKIQEIIDATMKISR
jgi:hypothetical protein